MSQRPSGVAAATPRPPFPTPEAAQDAFYAAFAATDLAAMAEVWGEESESLCIHPGGGPLKGKAAVMQSWMEIFSAAQPPSIEVEPVTGMTSGDLAVRVLVELIRPNGHPAEAASRVLATNVFRFREGSWYLVEHHASLPLRVRPHADDPGQRLH
jgi:ketosteroid isomerase-like protein